MPRVHYLSFISNSTGTGLDGIQLTVRGRNAATPTAVYADSTTTTALATPILTVGGKADFWVDDQVAYNITASGTGFSAYTHYFDAVSAETVRKVALYARPAVTLTDGATITADAYLGTIFKVTLGGNRTIGAPTNPLDGKQIIFKFKQDATGNRTITWNSIFRFSTDLPTVTLSTPVGVTDMVAFIYDATDVKWDCTGAVKGFS